MPTTTPNLGDTMRRTATALLAAALLASLTACGASEDGKATTTPKAKPTISKETRYLKAAHEITFNGEPSDDELTAFPPQWCDGLNTGQLLGEGNLYPIGDDWGTVKQDAYTLVATGTKAYCPENFDAVRDELRDAGAY
ncbi:hypothetical protein [Streptomyces sp. NBC_01445]|uniref:hypothetical protein n=1 Tax=Streptomyces sp. NBC_01445 TaxID=2903869 RepID=UPI002DDC6A73|nr:hypothetical protein [Streptomyces sp. NBC_01445]WSE02074.1 hypothetical protein OG574_00695 [Streptomyces sp. NBC_01445]WSE10256.1 hypothetical protein OG574_47315 [Streptomyces sp. NBC_01445]WSE11175.1 hypothetical protein OG574_48705 [Streptomyces sp. NBC_01445]